MACTSISSSFFTPLQLRHRPPSPPHFPATIFHPFPSIKLTPSHLFRLSALPSFSQPTGGNNNNNGGGGGGGGDSSRGYPFDSDDSSSSGSRHTLFLALLFSSVTFCFCQLLLAKFALANNRNSSTSSSIETEILTQPIYEVKGGNLIKLFPDHIKDIFIASNPSLYSELSSLKPPQVPIFLYNKCKDFLVRLMLPEGFPNSVTSDYLEYSLWRGVQGVACQVSGVLATQALLYAVGLGKGAIPTAAAINWVLKDGIGYLSKILLSDFGRHFDVNPKGWRLFADLLENAAFGLEMCTPAFPHLFVPIGAFAGASRSAASLIQASTRSCFFAGFAAQRNFAEVIAKGEVQGMASRFIGIGLGIGLGNCIGSSTPLVLASFCVVTWIHMYSNLKSYQSIQIRTLNPYRASLVFSEYLLSGQAPPVKEVNAEEPLFPAVPMLNAYFATKAQSIVLSSEAKDAAVEIESRLLLGSKLSEIINNKEEALALFSLYKNEGYLLSEHTGKFCVVLKENCSQQDMLKALFQVNYLYWLEKNAGIEGRGSLYDCKPGGRLQLSLEYAEREFDHVRNDGESVGWITDGLIARPLPNRIRPGNTDESHKIVAQYMSVLDAEVTYHKFHPQLNQFNPLHFFMSHDSGIVLKNISCSSLGINIAGIIRAPRGDGKESIVLVTPYNPRKVGPGEALSLGIAYSVFSLLSRVTWLAKDVIWLVADSLHATCWSYLTYWIWSFSQFVVAFVAPVMFNINVDGKVK